MGKLSPITRLFCILLFVQFWILCLAKNSSYTCFGNEREALLKFKESLADPSNRLSSWEEDTNCCNWDCVSCHILGYVAKLDLKNNGDSSTRLLSGSLDSSLLELKHLNYLDLRGNYFFMQIPAFLGSMKLLQHLFLSNASFYGIVPHHLGNLSNLQTLDLGGNNLIPDDLSWISNLSSLEYLDLSSIDLSRQKSSMKVLSMLPSLVRLHLRNNSLDNSHIPYSCTNSTLLSHVKYLDMAGNSFYGEIPCFVYNMTALEYLDLSHNDYNSTGQPFLRMEKLFHVDLGWNRIQQSTEWISELIGNNCHLELLDLSGNEFHGDISSAFKNLSRCRAFELKYLTLSDNRINGSIPDSVGMMSALVRLDISVNQLSGSIPESIGKLSSLTKLRISDNKLSGSIPDSIWKLSSLVELRINDNELSGSIPDSLGQLFNLVGISISNNLFDVSFSEAHFSELSKLKHFDAISNSIEFKVRYNWVPAFQLERLQIPSCNMEVDQFPPWLQTQKELRELDLSNCSISGTLPKWLGSMQHLTKLSLSKNHISGTIMELPSSISFLDLYDNKLTHLPSNIGHLLPNLIGLNLARNVINGTLPNSLCEMKHLAILHLSRNNLSGHLLDCWNNFPKLAYVALSYNELSGIIPKSLGLASSLRWLWLDNNRFTGQLPSTLNHCRTLKVLDVGQNKLFGEIPKWLGKNRTHLRILRLRNNQFNGVIPQELCQASHLQILDLGINNLTGYIPNCFQNFLGMKHDLKFFLSSREFRSDSLDQVIKGVDMEYTRGPLIYLANLDLSCNDLVGGIPSELTALVALQGLNLSHNNLHGEIPRMIGGMKSLESLDLSNNHLSGKIPQSLANLTSLSHLNLSNNNLSGQIPTGSQLRILDDGPSIYAGNPLLCGDPLPKKCHGDESPNHFNGENHVSDKIDKLCFYAFVIAGYASGLWGFFGILLFKRSWRHAFFGVIEAMIMKMMGS